MAKPEIIPPPQEQAVDRFHGGSAFLKLQPGETVQVRSEAEILTTLDEDLSLDALPFTPEMRKYCGGNYRILKKVKKIIVEGRSGLRRMRNAVILDGVTCDGSAHEGCQYTCQLIWREQWLKPPQNVAPTDDRPANPGWPATRHPVSSDGPFVCQSTSLFGASSPLPFWNIDQYFWDIQERILRPRILARTWFIISYNKIRHRFGLKKRYLFHGQCKTTPTSSLNLQPGELVQVKSREQIAATLDRRGRNRGLGFTQEMLSCCDKRYRVLKRMDRMIVETTGKMKEMADTVLLEGAICDGCAHFNCHRGCRSLWKEIWLERVQ